jgi:uncharacterized protein (DUF736 family)
VFALSSFGGRSRRPSRRGRLERGWLAGGLTYAGYNIIGAVVILPVTRHLAATATPSSRASRRAAGDAAGIPVLHLHVRVRAGHRRRGAASDYLLARLDQPWFRYLFQAMIFAALLESGTGAVHAVNERISTVWQAARARRSVPRARGALALGLLAVCMLIADRSGWWR